MKNKYSFPLISIKRFGEKDNILTDVTLISGIDDGKGTLTAGYSKAGFTDSAEARSASVTKIVGINK